MRKRKGGGGGHGGGGGGHDGAGGLRWLLTYADLITLLMVFFVVLYSISKVDQAKYVALSRSIRASLLHSNTANSIIDAAEVPANTQEILPDTAASTLDMEPSELLDLQQIGLDLSRAVEGAGLSSQVSIVIAERGLVISFADNVFFDLGRALVRPESAAVLARIAPILTRLPNKIVVEGHTDDLPIHTAQFPSNWELSVARAVAVARRLSERDGIDPRRLAATGYGEWRPRFPNANAENRAKNRRVDIVLLREAFGKGDAVQQVISGNGQVSVPPSAFN